MMMNQRSLLIMSLSMSLVTLGALHLLWGRKEFTLFPSAKIHSQAYYYCDSADGGTSNATLLVENHRLLFAYTLGYGFGYPYCGVGLPLQTDTSKAHPRLRNLKRFDSLVVRYRTTASEQLRMQIITHDPEFSRMEKPLSYRYLLQNISAGKGLRTARLSIEDFSTPEWWYQLNGLTPDPSRKFLDRAVRLEIQSGPGLVLHTPDTLEIQSLVLVGPNPWLPWISGGILLVLVSGFGFLIWAQKERVRLETESLRLARREENISQYNKLPVESHRDRDSQRLLEWIHANYSDAELSLESATKATGINRNRMTVLLREAVGSTFKVYVNEIRLREAARLLTETDLQVTEIAFQVGYGNVSHFNRVFKEKFEKAPVEYRRAQAHISP